MATDGKPSSPATVWTEITSTSQEPPCLICCYFRDFLTLWAIPADNEAIQLKASQRLSRYDASLYPGGVGNVVTQLVRFDAAEEGQLLGLIIMQVRYQFGSAWADFIDLPDARVVSGAAYE